MNGLLQKEFHIFISYAREDTGSARRLFNDLKNVGWNPWLDEESILPGQDWQNEIRTAIKNSDFFIPLFSSISIKKRGYVQKEFKLALEVFKEFPPSAIFAIPARLDECNIPYEELRNIHYADLFPDWQRGFQKILQTIEFQNRLNNETSAQTALIGETLEKIDEKGLEIKSYVTGRPASDFKPRVLAEQKQDKIIFKDTQFCDHIYKTITPDNFKTLDAQTRKVLRRYEKDMLQAFNDWDKWRELHQREYSNRIIDNELRDIIHVMCDNWSKIVKQLGRLRIGLEDHYYGIYGICDDFGFVER